MESGGPHIAAQCAGTRVVQPELGSETAAVRVDLCPWLRSSLSLLEKCHVGEVCVCVCVCVCGCLCVCVGVCVCWCCGVCVCVCVCETEKSCRCRLFYYAHTGNRTLIPSLKKPVS